MIVLDTHVWLWLCLEPRRLSARAVGTIRRAVGGGGGIAVASITLWEVAMMLARGASSQGTPEMWLGTSIDRSAVVVKEITPAVAALPMHFPDDFPGDPADRLIAATARAEAVPLVTRDARLRSSPLIETAW